MPTSLNAALRRWYPHITAPEVSVYRMGGWTASLVEAIEVLTQWSVEHGTGPILRHPIEIAARGVKDPRPIETRTRLARDNLEALWKPLVHEQGLSAGEAVAWMTVFATVNDFDAYEKLAGMLRGDPAYWVGTDPGPLLSVEPWRVVGALGPLAYAAGLTPEEARVQDEARTLSVPGLLMLAALRDWDLPPLGMLPNVGG